MHKARKDMVQTLTESGIEIQFKHICRGGVVRSEQMQIPLRILKMRCAKLFRRRAV